MKNKRLQGILALTLTGFVCSVLLYLVFSLVGV
jgi:dolichol kinase